jgi:hypothetical protein
MTLKQTLLVISLCILSTLQAFCQPKQSGYIVSLQGDTSYGFIQLKNSRLIPRKIYFYNSTDFAEGQVFAPPK